ncbi:MAG: galactose-1-phosphate uridylyltransferase [Nitrospirae bacterium RBG_19FT_COMBO_55_12]|nr:MAG: galactose-1-phosphate uridylyltransferase [Nitrospirae bacterium RBG_19FT_COMBO_55_12]
MSRLRKDPIIGRWIIVSTELPKKPEDYSVEEPNDDVSPAECPFCAGNESRTPPEISAFRPEKTPPNTKGWWVRVIPSKFPALHIEGNLEREGSGIYDWMNGVGAHEIIIESPEHALRLEDLPQNQGEKVLWAYRDRILDLERDQRLRYVLIFKNQGWIAGSAMNHPQSQIIATPVIPNFVKEKLDGAKSYYDYKERCIFCDMIRQELSSSERVIEETRHFLVMAPFAPRFPFEVWIFPKRHLCSYVDITKEEIMDFSRTLKSALTRLGKTLNNPPYNYMLYTAPNRLPRRGHWHTLNEDFHWHLEIIPRLTRIAGFEWGSGFYINHTPPEDAAKYLREVKI